MVSIIKGDKEYGTSYGITLTLNTAWTIRKDDNDKIHYVASNVDEWFFLAEDSIGNYAIGYTEGEAIKNICTTRVANNKDNQPTEKE